MRSLVGYACASTDERNLDRQRNALCEVGCAEVIEDAGVSGAANERPGLTGAPATCGLKDLLIVRRLDPLGRSLGRVMGTITELWGGGADRGGCNMLERALKRPKVAGRS